MGVDHYENFPVASVLMPARLRGAVKAIYRFARTADDIADEGDAPASQRLSELDALERMLTSIEAGHTPAHWQDLAHAVVAHRLPLSLLRDLLSAFRQDVTLKRYAKHADVLDYCRRSANPVGRLLLHLYERAEDRLLTMSDAICTGLQLANFLQDVAVDWRKDRVYIPLDALRRHGLSEITIHQQHQCETLSADMQQRWRELMREEVESARALLKSGAPLAHALGGRIGWELRLVVQGGLRILERIDAVHGDVFQQRPQLRFNDWTLMLWRALQMRA